MRFLIALMIIISGTGVQAGPEQDNHFFNVIESEKSRDHDGTRPVNILLAKSIGGSVKPERPVQPIYKPRPVRPVNRSGHYGYSDDEETVIIKEKEVIVKEVEVQPPPPEKESPPPVYREKTIPGHWTHGIEESVDEKGVRTFTDDSEKKIWVPEKKVKELVPPKEFN